MKEYIKPEIVIIEAETEAIMAASGLGYDTEGTNISSRSRRRNDLGYDDWDDTDNEQY